jgi:voltage-gated potassium channel
MASSIAHKRPRRQRKPQKTDARGVHDNPPPASSPNPRLKFDPGRGLSGKGKSVYGGAPVFKSLPAQITTLTAQVNPRAGKRNLRFLVIFGAFLVGIVMLYTVLFHWIMEIEGQSHSWLSGLYWTLVTMSTLGFGDITFHTDLGRGFSVIVLVSGMLLLLALLPFTFIEFFYSPFMKAQQEARAPRTVPPGLREHVILTHYDAVTAALIRKLVHYRAGYVLIVREVEQALALHDLGVKVVVADLGDPASFERCGFGRAALVAATGTDFENTSIAFTARQMSGSAVIVATAGSKDSVDVLSLAGCTHVMQLGELLGGALARRTIAADAQAHVIGEFGKLRIAEAIVAGTPLQGKTLLETRLRELCGVNVIGLWQRGVFLNPLPDLTLSADTLLMLAGTDSQIESYNELFCIYHHATAPCVIIGAGRVGCAAAAALDPLDYRVIDKNPEKILDPKKFIHGSAADHAVLVQAGIESAPAVLITTRDDDANIYLTIYCRKLRPDIQILARANLEPNVARLHGAGADVVMSYASMGANSVFNLLRNEKTLLVAEGLNVFHARTPAAVAGRTIAESNIRARTGCSIIAVGSGDNLAINPPPETLLDANQELLLIGTLNAEEQFVEIFGI